MNLRSKILMTLFALGTILMSSCDSLIYEDMTDCPQGVYVKFYSMTPCAVDSAFIGNVPSLTVFAFDDRDLLAVVVVEQNVNLNSDFNVFFPVSNGNYSFTAWAGIDGNFDVRSFTPGVTTKKDVMLALNATDAIAANLQNTRVWRGESPVVNLPNPAEYGTVYKYTAVNLQEVTNRIKLIVEIDPLVEDVTPQDLAVAVSSANGVININGTMPIGSEILNYPILNTSYTDNSVTWDFTLMELVTGYNNRLNIVYAERDHVVFNGDLIGSILLNTIENNVNLACENDFTVKFVLRDYCAECATHFSCGIFVNGWPVHSYEIEF